MDFFLHFFTPVNLCCDKVDTDVLLHKYKDYVSHLHLFSCYSLILRSKLRSVLESITWKTYLIKAVGCLESKIRLYILWCPYWTTNMVAMPLQVPVHNPLGLYWIPWPRKHKIGIFN